ncbi:3-deoxy-D-manno-octulosonic acid transferase [Paracoccus homiensis]|uniref:3-deoxy-D-manno-octulosonic acid transferase n=1 Tax=Paracoccus homiensis TaxID=364199 RepID=A0A1I0C668_9RHOB|nr:glycosyltransferase N-terminal domain-containing protein [Paracoccus homiensis]SET14597.1 3-deoxy-D-manno-octulosonic-acid transferase [Paracoccus homiensis]
MIYAASTGLAETVLRLRARLGGSEALRERLVRDLPRKPASIWIHGASVGELTSARPIIEALARDFSLQITANSVTGRDMVIGWGLPARLAPLDLPRALGRFLDAVQPQMALTIEQELWPLKSRLLEGRGIRQAVIGARMSEGSSRKWARLRGVISPMLGRIDALSAQDAASESRLRDLGLRENAILPVMDLKLLAPASIQPPAPDPARNRVMLAASTHEGEDGPVLDGWLKARQIHPDLRLILAPRHPQRGDAIAQMMRDRGIAFSRRSQGAEDAPVLLADTLGEMALWYGQAGICLVGGSLIDKGGHTPWEPAAYRCALLHGPHIANHATGFDLLTRAGAARKVTSADLGAKLIALVQDPAQIAAMGRTARDVLTARVGDPQTMIARLGDLARRRD